MKQLSPLLPLPQLLKLLVTIVRAWFLFICDIRDKIQGPAQAEHVLVPLSHPS